MLVSFADRDTSSVRHCSVPFSHLFLKLFSVQILENFGFSGGFFMRRIIERSSERRPINWMTPLAPWRWMARTSRGTSTVRNAPGVRDITTRLFLKLPKIEISRDVRFFCDSSAPVGRFDLSKSKANKPIVPNVLAARGGPTYSQNSSRENLATQPDDSTETWEFGLN